MASTNLKAASSNASQTTVTPTPESTLTPTPEPTKESTSAPDVTVAKQDTNPAVVSVQDSAKAVSNDSVAEVAVADTVQKDLVVIPEPTQAPTPAPTPAPLVVQKPVVVEAAVPVNENAATTDYLERILKTVPGSHQTDINRILMYVNRMKPGRPIDVKMGGAEQVALYRSIQNIINRQDDYFTQLFTALLYIFEQEAMGALGDRYRMRFMDSINLHAGDRKGFMYLTQMLHIVADPKSREIAIKQINMELALQNGLTAEGRTRVLNYFNV